MQVAFLIAFLMTGNQPQLAQLGDCRVCVRAAAGYGAGVAFVQLRGKTVWSRKCDSGLVTTYQDLAGGNFPVLTPPTGLTVFRPTGSILKQIALPAARDPRPFLCGGSFAVWGENVFNWILLDEEDLRWQNQTRRFFAVDLRNGHSKRLPSYRQLGVPLAVSGSSLIAVAPVNWNTALLRRKARRFWIRSIDLRDGGSRKAVVSLSEGVGRRLLLDIIGWDSWKETMATFGARSGRLTVTGLHEGRQAPTIDIPEFLHIAKSRQAKRP
jgi:hypothetical protein